MRCIVFPCRQFFDVTLVAPSGYLNAAWCVSGATYSRLRDEAARAVEYLDDPDVDSFQVCRGEGANMLDCHLWLEWKSLFANEFVA